MFKLALREKTEALFIHSFKMLQLLKWHRLELCLRTTTELQAHLKISWFPNIISHLITDHYFIHLIRDCWQPDVFIGMIMFEMAPLCQ